MRFIIADEFYHQMLEQEYHPPDCYVREGEYLHHMYIEGVKYTVAQAVFAGLAEAESRGDVEAIDHLTLHRVHYELLLAEAERIGPLEGVTLLGDAPPTDEEATPVASNLFTPRVPTSWEELGLSQSFLFDMILRAIYTNGQTSGGDLADMLCIPFPIVNGLASQMRRQSLIDIANQRGNGDSGFVYDIKPPKGTAAVEEAMSKTAYVGPVPVPFADYAETVMAQTIKKLIVTRRSIRKAFEDLIISESSFNEIGPAVNSTSSIFFFGYPGNGKTSIAERITKAFGEYIWIPRAIGVDGEILRLFDPNAHTVCPLEATGGIVEQRKIDRRWIRIRRPTIVVGGELTMENLEVTNNRSTGISEAPVQMKSNCGTLVVDDFGRQKMSVDQLLNRWIVPLEKRYDFLNMASGKKIQVPFDQLIIFSTNLQPKDLVDEAFLRRIPYKIDVMDPSEAEFRQLFKILAPKFGFVYQEEPLTYLIQKHYKSANRPFRNCQPRDLLLQIRNFCRFMNRPPVLTNEYFDVAIENYFAVM
jgi:hypothetical protein